MMRKLKDILPDPYTSNIGIFQTLNIVPSEYDARNLDILLFERYGDRLPSKIVKRYDQLTDCELGNLASIIEDRFRTSWEKLYLALTIDYDPIENYNGIEEVVVDGLQKSNGKVDTTVSDKTKNDATTNNKIYGFNSSNGVNADSTTTSFDNESVTGSEDENELKVDTKTTTLRHGNLGVTSSQDMINQELRLRTNTQYIDTIIKNVGDMLTLKIYI